MHIKHLSLTNFRNYARLEMDLQARVYLLQGLNAQGKTNLLEAIAYLSMTKSPLTSLDRQIMNWSADQEVLPHAHAQAHFFRQDQDRTIEVTLLREPSADPTIAKLRKQFRVDGVPKRAMDAIGHLNTVLFLPQDIRLIDGSPSARRRYLDALLCQIDIIYCRTLSRYNRTITQRNALLKQIRERGARPSELRFWDDQIIELGATLLKRRFGLVTALASRAGQLQSEITGGQEVLDINYLASVDPEHVLSPDASIQEISKAFANTLGKRRREEATRGMTLVGPHRDDMRCLVHGIDLTDYGSRGQQRTAALSLKLAEVQIMEQETGERPVLLLDDVVSELDWQRSQSLFGVISQADQVLITTTDIHFFDAPLVDSALLYQIENGQVSPMSEIEKSV